VLLQCFGMLQVREVRFNCVNSLVVLRICAPSMEHWLQKMRFVGSNAFSLTLLYTQYKPGLGKLVQWKSHLQKIKNTSEPQNQFVVSIQIR